MKTHGHSGSGINKSATYHSWQAMLSRCNYRKNKQYADYGGRGIKVCADWSSFEVFLKDMGERPAGMTLDRYPNNAGNYELSNCRWATRKEQQRNSRRTTFLTLGDKCLPLRDWADLLKINADTIRNRIRKGLSVEFALTMPVMDRTANLRNQATTPSSSPSPPR